MRLRNNQHASNPMGAHPYEYYVPFEPDAQSALDKLRQRVFASGDYATADLHPSTPEEAFELGEEEGTASILDIAHVAAAPDFCCAAPFTADELLEYFGTDEPSRDDLRAGDAFWDDLDRGQARFATVYAAGRPTELYFVGYSFD